MEHEQRDDNSKKRDNRISAGEKDARTKALVVETLEQCRSWSIQLQARREKRNKSAVLLGRALLPLAQRLCDTDKVKSSAANTSSMSQEPPDETLTEGQVEEGLCTYVTALQRFSEALQAEEQGREATPQNYPTQAVAQALEAIGSAMAQREREAKLTDALAERWRTVLGHAQTEAKGKGDLDRFSPEALESFHRKSRKELRDLADRQYLAKKRLDDAREEDDEEAEDESRQLLEDLKKSMAQKQSQAHTFRGQAVQQLVKHNPEVLVSKYWTEVKGQKKPPRWAEKLIDYYDVDGLLQSDLTFEMYSDKKLLTSTGANHPVYSATRNGQRVALKRYSVNDRDKRKMLKEARLLRRLGQDPLVCGINLTFWDSQHNYLYVLLKS